MYEKLNFHGIKFIDEIKVARRDISRSSEFCHGLSLMSPTSLHIYFLGKKWGLHNGGLAHAHQVQQSQFTCGIYLHLLQIMDEINYKLYLLDDFITQMVSSKLLRGNRDEREHDALQCFFSKFVMYPKWQSSVGRRFRKNWQLVPRRFSQIWV